MNFIAELKRRNVIRMAGLYLVGAWLVVQVASILLPVFEAPGWMMKTLVGLLAVGFVPALVFSWVFELTPEGIKRDEDVPPEASMAPQTARRMDRMIIGGLAAVILFMGVERFWPRAATERDSPKPTATGAPEAAGAIESIAVLAFRNTGGDADKPGHTY